VSLLSRDRVLVALEPHAVHAVRLKGNEKRTAAGAWQDVLPEVLAARRRGIRFDVGNGRTAHITWEMVEAATRDGFWPDTISSDITGPGRTVRVFDLPTVVSKFLMLGMPIDRAVACVTSHAAAAVSAFRNLGTLRPGSVADLAVLEVREGDFEFVDNANTPRKGATKLFAHATVVAGKLVRRPA